MREFTQPLRTLLDVVGPSCPVGGRWVVKGGEELPSGPAWRGSPVVAG